MNLPNSISRTILWRYVNKKLKHKIHYHHILSIINILFDEIIIDLKEKKEIKIKNFGSLILKDYKSRKYFDIVRKKVMTSKKFRLLKFNISKKLKKKLVSDLDFVKTFIERE